MVPGLPPGARLCSIDSSHPENVQSRLPGMSHFSSSSPLRLLILGGTGFIGPHMVRYAMYRGHEVTLFNRGRTNPGLFPGTWRR